jgi:hypothetical protein
LTDGRIRGALLPAEVHARCMSDEPEVTQEHRNRRAQAHRQAAATHEEAAVLHEHLADEFDDRGDTVEAERQRRLSDENRQEATKNWDIADRQ